MSIGDKLSRLRKESNYTQEQLADILGVSRQAISKWESDVAYPEMDKLIRLSTLYHCSLDYLVKDEVDTVEGVTSQQNVGVGEKANKLFKGILRFAPMVLYALWALLLWAFYAVPLLKLSDNNLYQWFGNGVASELQPNINALISLGVISGAYIAVLGVLQRFANKKANLIANLCSFVFQAGVFVCVMCLIGVCKGLGLESGKVVVVVSSVTGSFALLQAAFIALDRYFNHDEAIDLKPTRTIAAVKKCWKCISLHKVTATVVACVLFVCIAAAIVLPIVLPRTVGNPFDTNKISRIQLGDSRDTVTEILGEPLDIDTKKLAEIIGNDEANAISKKNMYYYCSKNAEKFIKKALRMVDKLEQFNSSPKSEDAQILLAQLNKMLEELEDLEFRYIEVYFENGKVSGVEYDANFSMEREDDNKWDYRENDKQKIKLIPDRIPYGQTPFTTEVYAQIFYADGSYRLAKIEDVSAIGDTLSGWELSWHDHWGSYNAKLDTSYDNVNSVEDGLLCQNVWYIITESTELGKEGYMLRIYGFGAIPDRNEYPWSKYQDKIVEVVIEKGITNVPNSAFQNFGNLTTVSLSDSIAKIGDCAFYACENLTDITSPLALTEIGEAAFWECYSLTAAPTSYNVVSIGADAFYGCASLKDVPLPDTLISIGERAFYGCASIDGLVIPYSIMNIGDEAFANCSSLRYLDWNVTANCTVGEDVFLNAHRLTTVAVSRMAEVISAGLFRNCSGLTEVDAYWSKVQFIGARAFENCVKLRTIRLPIEDDEYTEVELGEYAFANCQSLFEIKIRTSVYPKGVFYGCTSLYEVNSSSIWHPVREVQDDAFNGCVKLQNVYFGGSSSIRKEVTYVGERAFYNCSSIQSIFLNTYTLEIRPYAFYGCTSLTFVSSDSHWRVKANDQDEGEHKYIGTSEELVQMLTGAYCSYIWIKEPLSY